MTTNQRQRTKIGIKAVEAMPPHSIIWIRRSQDLTLAARTRQLSPTASSIGRLKACSGGSALGVTECGRRT